MTLQVLRVCSMVVFGHSSEICDVIGLSIIGAVIGGMVVVVTLLRSEGGAKVDGLSELRRCEFVWLIFIFFSR